MPISPQEMDWMQRYAAGAPPAELRQQIPSMYNEPTMGEIGAALAPQPDAREAQNMSVEPAMSVDPGLQSAPMPATPPVATDAGGMSGGGPAMSVAPEPTMSTVSPEQQRQMGAEAEARLAAAAPTEGMASTEAQPEQNPVDRAMQRYLLGIGRPGGRYQQGGEQLAERSIKRDMRAPLSPETAQELEDAGIDAQGLAVGQGESAATQLEKQARAQGQQAQRAREELASYKRNTAAKDAEYDIRRSELDDMRTQVQREPITFFSGDTTGHAVTKAIGLSMLGILAGPMAVMQAVNNSIAQKEKERGHAISLLDDQLNRFKDGIPDPQARSLYIRSLGMDAAASEADRMANMAKSEDARQRGFSIAEGFRMEALKARAAAETASQATEEIKTKNMPGKWVGGGKSREELIIERGAKAKKGAEESLAGAMGIPRAGGEEPQTEFDLAKRKHERELSVRLPSGQEAFASTSKQKESLQRDLQAADATQKIYEDLAKISEHHAVTNKWDREALGRVKADSAALLLKLRESEKEGGGLRLSGEMADLLGPLIGKGAEDWIVGDQFKGSLNRARELSRSGETQARELLSASPYRAQYITTPAGGSGSTFKPHAAPKEEH